MLLITFIALAFIALLPIGIVRLFPQQRKFFKGFFIRGFGLGAYGALIVILIGEVGKENIQTVEIFYTLGIIISIVIGMFFVHHHHEETETTHKKKDVLRILGSDFLHNIVDGIVIIGAFTLGTQPGIVASIGVFLHQMLQQIGQQVLLIDSGMQPKKAIKYSVLISLSIFIGLFISMSEQTEHILMMLSAGIVTVTVLEDIKHSLNKKILGGLVVGFTLMLGIVYLFPHSHEKLEIHASQR